MQTVKPDCRSSACSHGVTLGQFPPFWGRFRNHASGNNKRTHHIPLRQESALLRCELCLERSLVHRKRERSALLSSPSSSCFLSRLHPFLCSVVPPCTGCSQTTPPFNFMLCSLRSTLLQSFWRFSLPPPPHARSPRSIHSLARRLPKQLFLAGLYLSFA